MRLADADGPAAVSIAALADKLSVKPPSLYAHVGGLDDVWRRLGVRGLRMLASEIGRAVEGRSGDDALRALAIAYRDFAREHPGLYEASQRSVALADDPDATTAGNEVVSVVVRGLRGYDLAGDDAVHAVRMLRVALHGFVTLELSGGFAYAISVDETFERLLLLLSTGFQRGASRES
jgi:AcrR family transcriptional regulator